MKKYLGVILLIMLMQTIAFSQSQEVQQLLLNVEKLAQFKKILQNMKDGYVILTNGYNTIKGIAERDFSLHKTFLDGLLAVSPTVRKYRKIADIIGMQVRLVQQYKTGLKRFKQSGQFTVGEIEYLARVYGRLFDQSIQNLDELTMVVTAGKMRMSDEERLAAIDKLFVDMEDKLAFLTDFNGKTALLAKARAEESSDVKTMQDLYKK